MADVSYTTSPNGFQPVRSGNGGIELEWGTLLSAVKAGDLLTWDSGGKLKAHTAAAAAERIVGVAQADGIANDEIPYVSSESDILFEAEWTGSALDAFNIRSGNGALREITGASGVMAIHATNATNGIVRIVGWAPGYDPGFGNTCTNGRVLCKIAKGMAVQA